MNSGLRPKTENCEKPAKLKVIEDYWHQYTVNPSSLLLHPKIKQG